MARRSLATTCRRGIVGRPASFEPRAAHPRATAVFGLVDGPLSFGLMARGTLARLDQNDLAVYGGCAPGTTSAVDVSGDGRLLFARCDSGDLAVLDAGSGAVLRMVPVGQGVMFAATFDGSAVVVARPTIGGSTVGSAPGLTDVIAFDAGAAPTLTVPAAPPGRYYVRVRAENVSGRSAPSSEIVVDVP